MSAKKTLTHLLHLRQLRERQAAAALVQQAQRVRDHSLRIVAVERERLRLLEELEAEEAAGTQYANGPLDFAALQQEHAHRLGVSQQQADFIQRAEQAHEAHAEAERRRQTLEGAHASHRKRREALDHHQQRWVGQARLRADLLDEDEADGLSFADWT